MQRMQRVWRLKEFRVQGANQHNAQWALAWLCTEYHPTSTAAVKIIAVKIIAEAEAEWTLMALHFNVP